MKNGKDTLLSDSSLYLPNVSGGMRNWFLPIVFTCIKKEVINFKEVETHENISFKGVMQPMKPQELQFKPEGQRDWKWHVCHTEVGTPFNLDDVVLYNGVKYRVLSKADFSKYGYLKYDLVEDYAE